WPFPGDPGNAGSHQGERYGEPAFLERKTQGKRERSDCAGGEDRNRSFAGRALASLAQGIGGKGKSAGKEHGGCGKGDRAVESGNAPIERDQNGKRGTDSGCTPQDGDKGVAGAGL